MMKTFIMIAGLTVMLYVFYILLQQLKDHKYVQDYDYLLYLIDNKEVTYENFTIICKEFDNLYRNNASPESTQELKKHFMDKYQLYHQDVYNYNS